MPRTIDADWTTEHQQSHVRAAHRLEIAFPSPSTTVLRYTDVPSDPLWTAVIRQIGAIPSVASTGDGVPEGQSFEVELSNAKRVTRAADDLNRSDLEGSTARLYSLGGTDEDGIYQTEQLIWTGVVLRMHSVTIHSVRLRLGCRMVALNRRLSNTVGELYPKAPPSTATRIRQIVYGSIPRLRLQPVEAGLIGVLESTVSAAATEIPIKDGVDLWPSAGGVAQLDNELIQFTGITAPGFGNSIVGCTRGAYGTTATTHEAGAVIVERPSTYRFLVADRTYGAVKAVHRVFLRGKTLPATSWSFDAATNLVTLNYPSPRAGRQSMSRLHATHAGLWESAGHAGAGSSVFNAPSLPGIRATSSPSRPLLNASHSMLWPYGGSGYAATKNDAWFWWTERQSSESQPDDVTPGAGDHQPDTSEVKLYANTPKTWAATVFESYVPPANVFTRTGMSVALEIVPRREQVRTAPGTTATRLLGKKVHGLRVTLGGVTKTIPLGIDDHFASSGRTEIAMITTSNIVRPAQFAVVEFPELDPASAPFALTIEVLSTETTGDYVATLQNVCQSVDGALPFAVAAETKTGTETVTNWDGPGTRGRWGKEVTVTFSGITSWTAAVLSFSLHMQCDYVRVTCGSVSARIYRPLILPGIHGPSSGAPDTHHGFACIVLGQPGANVVTFRACNLGESEATSYPQDGTAPYVRLGGCVIAKAATTADSRSLVTPALEDSAFLLEHGEYPVAEVDGYLDPDADQSTELMRNPSDVIKHWLNTVCGEAETYLDTAVTLGSTGRAAYSALSYAFDGVVDEAADKRVPLLRLARECRSDIVWDPVAAKWKLLLRRALTDEQAAAADHAITMAHVIETPPTLDRTDEGEIIDKVNARYLRDWTQGAGMDSYAGIVTAGSGQRTADERFLLDFVRTKAHALSLANFWLDFRDGALLTFAARLWPWWLKIMKHDVATVTIPIPRSSPAAYLLGCNAKRFRIPAMPGYVAGGASGPDAVEVLFEEIPS